MEFFDGLLGAEELEYLKKEAEAIDGEIACNKQMIKSLKAQVEEMWKVSDHTASSGSDITPSLPSPPPTAATPIIVDNSGPTDPQLASLKDKDKDCSQQAKAQDDRPPPKSEPPRKTAEYMLVGLFMHRGSFRPFLSFMVSNEKLMVKGWVGESQGRHREAITGRSSGSYRSERTAG